MIETGRKQSKFVLKGVDALELWREGSSKWNQWIDDNPACDINFDGLSFHSERMRFGDISFAHYRFGNGNVSFTRTKFGDGPVDFSYAKFGNGDVGFVRAEFGRGGVNFSKSAFGTGNVVFTNTSFGNGNINFSQAQFGSGNFQFSESNVGDGFVDFYRTDFGNGDVTFFSSKFGKGHINFLETIFGEGHLVLNQSKFSDFYFRPASTKLKTIKAKGVQIDGLAVFTFPEENQALEMLNLGGASFRGPLDIDGDLGFIPDLRASSSPHQVELSSLTVKLRRIPSNSTFKRLSLKVQEFEDAARLRRLKEIAENNRDHRAALRFSADENRARRWIETSWSASILDISFSAFSDYGQNILRPLISLILLTLTSIGLYKAFSTAEMLTRGNSWGHATTLAASNSLPFLPQSRSLRDDAIEVLYSNDPSLLVDAIMVGQGALSFIFLFLIGLGLRNRFRL